MASYTLRLLFNKKLDKIEELYLNMSLRAFALSLIEIFIPIYLLKLDYSLVSVLFFYATINGVHALFVLPATKIASKFGFKHSISFSTPFLIIFYLLLYTLELYQWPLYWLAIIFGISRALFWLGYHTDFSKVSNGKYRGEEVSFAKFFKLIFGVAGPVVGGLILTFFSFKLLFIIVSLLLLGSAIPLFLSKDVYQPIHFSIKRFFKARQIKDLFGFMGYGIETGVGMTIWPIFIFFTIVDNFAVLGSVKSVSLLFSLLFIFIIGRLSDIRRRSILRMGALFNAFVWGIKTFVRTSLQVFVIDSFYGMTKMAIAIPFDALSYDKAVKSNILESIAFREISIQVGRMIFFLLMILIADLTIGLLFGSGASLLLLLF